MSVLPLRTIVFAVLISTPVWGQEPNVGRVDETRIPILELGQVIGRTDRKALEEALRILRQIEGLPSHDNDGNPIPLFPRGGFIPGGGFGGGGFGANAAAAFLPLISEDRRIRKSNTK